MSLRKKGLSRLSVKRSASVPESSFSEAEEDENFNNLRLIAVNEMAYRSEYIVRWLWYAFDAFDDQKCGRLSKMQLKMLTAHLGSARLAKQTTMMATSVTSLLNGTLHSPTDTMSFDEYREFLLANNCLDPQKMDLCKLEEACWMLCNKVFMSRTPKLPAVNGTVLFNLWRLFTFYTEPDSQPPYIHPEEAACLTEKLLVAMGAKYERDKFEQLCQTLGDQISLLDYLRCLETQYLPDLDAMCVSEGVACVHRSVVEEQEKVGFLKKKGHNFTAWRDRWFVLKLGSLAYYLTSDLKEQKGEIDLKADWKVETLPDVKGLKNLFVLYRSVEEEETTEKMRYEMQAPDPLTRQEWITALKYLIIRSNGAEESDLWKDFQRRYQARLQRRESAEEGERKRLQDEEEREKQRQEMENLKQAHSEAERKASEEAELRRAREIEEEENRQREMEHRQKTQKEIEDLKMAHEDALRQAREEAERREKMEVDEAERRKLEEEQKERMMREFAELQSALQDAEKKAAIEAALKEANQERQHELEDSLQHLAGLLEEEKQAKQDEEIVRSLQARLLEEETQKREELEKLKEQQEQMLEQEQQERHRLEQVSEELQTERLEQQRLLEQERQRLLELENERKSADEQLKEAMDKLIAAEQKKREEERRKRELERPVGLARLIQPKANPLKTHRGMGAFTESQFDIIKQLRKQWKEKNSPTSPDDHSLDKTSPDGQVQHQVNGGSAIASGGIDTTDSSVPQENGSREEDNKHDTATNPQKPTENGTGSLEEATVSQVDQNGTRLEGGPQEDSNENGTVVKEALPEISNAADESIDHKTDELTKTESKGEADGEANGLAEDQPEYV